MRADQIVHANQQHKEKIPVHLLFLAIPLPLLYAFEADAKNEIFSPAAPN